MYVCVCVFFTLNRSSTRRHPAHPVSALILHPRKISSVVTSYDTEIMHRNAFDNAMSCSSTGYDRHNIHTSATEIHWKREYDDVLGHVLSPLLSIRGRDANRQERLVYMRSITLPR